MRIIARLLICFSWIALLSTCDTNFSMLNRLEQIKQKGVIKVLTRIDPTTYYEGPDGYTGLEYDLALLFAEHLGVKAHFVIPETFDGILARISRGKGDIAAAGLTITKERQEVMRFSLPYDEITEQLIYRGDKRRPKDIPSLNGGVFEIVKSTSHEQTLLDNQLTFPELKWDINSYLDTNALLYLVNEGLIDYTLADSNQLQLLQRIYPKLEIAFDISEPRQLAWALENSHDSSLYDEVNSFFSLIKQNKTLEQLLERHYGHANVLSYQGNCTFRRHIRQRLPKYQTHFMNAADQYHLDWRLLAAIGYQESHWLKDTTSPTGVKGLMMLTNITASEMGISNRTDPYQSIEGGAHYFSLTIDKIPTPIPEPDRTWFALAAYNVGKAHVEDARILTAQQGSNPDKWVDVKKRLPLLSQPKWHKKTRHGYARGNEATRYVENIRSYYDLLVWLTEENIIEKNAMQIEAPEPEFQTPPIMPLLPQAL
ncbi:MAG: membrane-bound lytic murein transglycosylase MltF [Methylicorpusculum sp.]|uniref:membrane-bound lytic murein transglycosylase MltF n=1 Tax=Methylicorpusculum sp. TaxID=2713644 RepID=UPI00271CBDD4|nr:membrane-bound lytic murein transglycosylase MltF [Methylicorpusculum sp.]MDO8939214.1 membrane-bound lytic murein transglycosylase MltF [Methylicorpusculum sp.]MDO9239217.1 membrane-bound lytic murein transglycosylase MltF [Methylicorpusculum sp.]MDP2204170.1 membrane-bound lytic murein transglycosylase MltF [Methylicorpusculum sp.]